MFLLKPEDKEKKKIFKVKYYNGKITQREGNTVKKEMVNARKRNQSCKEKRRSKYMLIDNFKES